MESIAPLLSGTLLVLVTWFALLAVIGLAGAPIAMVVRSRAGESSQGCVTRQSLWWGLALVTILILFVSLFWPLASARSFVLVLAPLAALAGVGLVLALRSGTALVGLVGRLSGRMWLVALVGVLVMSYFAVAALGPANNYDTGLYHLGAIKYAAEYGLIPGLSNLYFPLGYSNSQFALAGWFASTPWGPEGYRLLNGLLILLAVVDLGIRWLERRTSPGTWVLTLGLTAAAFPLIAIADFWVTSPTSDSAVLVLTIVASAYLVDALVERRGTDAGVSLVVVTLMVAMRPTMLVFASAVVMTLLVAAVRSQQFREAWPRYLPVGFAVGLVAGLVGGLQLARDRVLSGWLVYPLSVLPLDVPWRSPDPTPFRDATLAAARDPLAPDQYQVAHSWEWVGPWFTARWLMWETYMILGLLVLGLIAWLVLRPSDRRMRLQVLVTLWVPSAAALGAWFLASPPSYRFAWGPLVIFGIAPMAAVMVARQRAQEVPLGASRWIARACGALVVSLVAITLTTRTDFASIDSPRTWDLTGLSIPYVVTSQPTVDTTDLVTEGGVTVRVPRVGDQCWDTYPLCSPLPTPSLGFLGSDMESGFSS